MQVPGGLKSTGRPRPSTTGPKHTELRRFRIVLCTVDVEIRSLCGKCPEFSPGMTLITKQLGRDERATPTASTNKTHQNYDHEHWLKSI
jgi:hypothetical protein